MFLVPQPATEEIPTTGQPTTRPTPTTIVEPTTIAEAATAEISNEGSNDITNTTSQETMGVAFIAGVAAGGGVAFTITIVLALVITIAVIVARSRTRTQGRESSQARPTAQTDEPYSPSPQVTESHSTWGSASYYNTNPSLAPGGLMTENDVDTSPSHVLASEQNKNANLYCNIPQTEASIYDHPRPRHSIETGLSSTPSCNTSESNEYDYVHHVNASPKTTANEAYGVSMSCRNQLATDTLGEENSHEYINTTKFM